ncbi:MAG: N-acetyltransferase [Deltaproteobacteria bacterium]|jgi:predicted N-acetyltransferase YhbS|nr:N-acetyltransferase [Deltaproteobacteria bacterium]
MIIRQERPEDHAAVERLTLAAFRTFAFPDGSRPERPCEHYLVHVMRDAAAFVPGLALVGEEDGEIVCNIMFTESRVVRPGGGELATLTFGPVSVRPDLQGHGLGTELINHGLNRARELGFGAVVIVGHPGYYPRFGFRPAGGYGLAMPDGSVMEPFMALELVDGYLGTGGGKWYADEVYEIDRDALAEWDAGFGEG